MAYDDTQCPCGGNKSSETMLCDLCSDYLADHPEMRVLRDSLGYSVNSRRGAAITLLALARRRRKAPVGNGVATARAIAGAMPRTMAANGAGVNVESD